MITNKGYVYDISKGYGSLKDYKYFSNGIKLTSKKDIVKAINLNLNLSRINKCDGLLEVFNYNNLIFEVKK
jgi:hypothetical protein